MQRFRPLVRRTQVRAPEFEEFVAAEGPRLLRLGHMLTGSPHDAADLAQETLVRMGERWSRLGRDVDRAAYARTTLVRLNVSVWRKHRRELLGAASGGAVDDARMTQVDLRDPLIEALNELGPRQRTVVVLATAYDLSSVQIAEQLGCSASTVRSQLARGLEHLRRLLGEDPRSESTAPTRRLA